MSDSIETRFRAMRHPDGVSVLSSARSDGVIVGKRLTDYILEIVAKSQLPIVSTGLASLDDAIGGGLELHSTTLIVAGTGKGKTSVALQIAAHHAEHAPVVFYAAEMGPYRIAARVIGQRTGRGWRDVLRAGISPEQMHAAVSALHMYVVPRQDNPARAIEATLAHARADGVQGTPMIVVDYVQLLADAGKDQRTAVMEAAREIRAFVETTPCVALVLSQTSRGGASAIRDGKEHAEELVGMGAETSELENSASNVLVLSYTATDGAEMHDVTLVVAKARDRGPGKIGLRYNGRTGVWTETVTIRLAPKEHERRREILRQIDVHARGECTPRRGGVHVHDLSRNTLCAPTKADHGHRVAGGREAVSRSLEAMVAEGAIRRVGNNYERASDAPTRYDAPMT